MLKRSRVRRPATNRRAKTAAPAAGPVSLNEARALARAKKPNLAVKAARATLAPPTPAAVGEERERLREEQRADRARRIRDYKATMKIMKQRGARPPRPKGGAKPKGGKVKAKAAAFAPLQIFAEGDSWFKYPPFILNGGIIPRLESRPGVPILNLAKAGDEVSYLLGVEERAILAEQFTNGCPAGGPWAVLQV